jgi:branched-chain amino acid transport system ATP-binding protein
MAGETAGGGMSDTLLDIQGLFKRFGGLVATNDCALDVREGELHALIGPNGAGKTTLIGQVAGAISPDSGRIRLAEVDITHLPPYRRVRLGLARTYQITNVFKKYTVLDNLALGVQARAGHSFRFWRPARAERHLWDQAAQIAERVGLGRRMDVVAGALAHGEQRQLEVGLALTSRPRLLLLDEPLAGMGADETGRMVDLIRALRADLTILLVEHDMDAVFQLADRISVLVYGRIIATGVPESIRANPEVQQAYLGDEVRS